MAVDSGPAHSGVDSLGLLSRRNRIGPVPEQEALEIGVEAYIYGYPLVTMEMTRRAMTNVDAPLATKAPMGAVRERQGLSRRVV